MRDVYVEFISRKVVVFRPGTAEAVTAKPSLEEVLAFAREEWPNQGIHVVISWDIRDLLSQSPPRCAHCG